MELLPTSMQIQEDIITHNSIFYSTNTKQMEKKGKKSNRIPTNIKGDLKRKFLLMQTKGHVDC